MLDEESFTQLLSAAYVMQEHQRQVTPRVAPADLNQILTQNVETQHQIRSRQLPTSTALDIIVDRLQKLGHARAPRRRDGPPQPCNFSVHRCSGFDRRPQRGDAFEDVGAMFNA